MRAGNLRHRITVERRTLTADDMGGFTESWDTLVSLWASINSVREKEYVESMQLTGEVMYNVKIRYYEGITIADRIKFNDEYYNIKSILNWQERNIFMELMVTKNE